MFKEKDYLEGNSPPELKARMLANLESDLSTEEGGFADTMMGPHAVELHRAYGNLESMKYIIWPTADSGSWIDVAADAEGITPRKPSEKAEVVLRITGTAGTEVATGTIFQTEEGLSYLASGTLSIPVSGELLLMTIAENGGDAYNVLANTITRQYRNDPKITAVTNPDPAAGGTDEESDASLFERLDRHRKKPAHSGNVYDYEQWALETAGVGKVKVLPLWDGNGTVGVVIADENYDPVDANIIAECTAHIETVRPVGADVTVMTATTKGLVIEAVALLQPDADRDTVAAAFTEKVNAYFSTVSFDDSIVYYHWIGALLMETVGVKDYTTLRVDGGTSNITLQTTEIPRVSEVVLT